MHPFTALINILTKACILSSLLELIEGLQENTDVSGSAGATDSGEKLTLVVLTVFVVTAGVLVAGCICISRSKRTRLKDTENPYIKKPIGIKFKTLGYSADRRTKAHSDGPQRKGDPPWKSLTSHKKHGYKTGKFPLPVQFPQRSAGVGNVHGSNPVSNLPPSNLQIRASNLRSNGRTVNRNTAESSVYIDPPARSLHIEKAYTTRHMPAVDKNTRQNINSGTIPMSSMIVVPASDKHDGPPSLYFTAPGGNRHRRLLVGGNLGSWGYRGTTATTCVFGTEALQQNGTVSRGRNTHDHGTQRRGRFRGEPITRRRHRRRGHIRRPHKLNRDTL